ncbi:hypothetical protein L484_020915 [Morus notabilis]|uniref:Uncharacterized protein n=1 Tax=Morus notabilis TaxID=981085 RepID=W9QZQ3_9ROSA|nr:hypothetical protein L484_020915 [Morus notabilis]
MSIWYRVLEKFRVVWAVPNRISELFGSDFLFGRSKNIKRLWNVAVLIVTCTLRLERNNRVFEDA